MDSKKFRTTDIFKSLENDMNKNGIMRDAKQIQIKYKSLKQNYNNARRALSQSGAGTAIKCPYFDELKEIFGHRPVSIQAGVDSLNIRQDENSKIKSSNIIDLEMYDNLPDPFDGAMPSTSYDEVMPSKIQNSTNIGTSIVDNINDNSCEIHKNTIIDNISNIDNSTNINNGNTSKINSNNNSNDELKKIEMNNKKEKFHTATHPLQSKKRQSFSQIFDKCVDKIISSNAEQIKTVVESNNKLMMEIMEKEKEMLQEQTQMLLQHFNTRQSLNTSPYSFSALNFPTNFAGQPRFQPFPQSNLPQSNLQLQTISNQSPRFVKIPLNTVEIARKFSSPRLVTPPLTPTPSPVSISNHIAEVPSSSPDNSQFNITYVSPMTEQLSCDIKSKTKSFKESNEKQE